MEFRYDVSFSLSYIFMKLVEKNFSVHNPFKCALTVRQPCAGPLQNCREIQLRGRKNFGEGNTEQAFGRYSGGKMKLPKEKVVKNI